MALKLSKNRDEICYPFIQDESVLCDFEVVTDELCGHIGEIIDLTPFDDLRADLEQLQPRAFHVNGSIRGRLAVEEADLAWLQGRLSHYQKEVSERLAGFVLPRGSVPVPQLHHARSCAKKAIRAMVRVDQEGIEVPLILPRLCNMMVNFFFVLTLVINQRRGIQEVPFVSKSYGRHFPE